MKTAISIPDPVFRAAERVAKRLSVSRSELYTRAIQAFLETNQGEDVTRKLNEVYADESSGMDAELLQMQALSVSDDSW
jgi:metal-responsive CopG/Arc/MetJ family transcriptional regulator